MKLKNKKYILIIILGFFLLVPSVLATTIRETLVNSDDYDTIEPNTFVIGVTKFSGDEIITAGKASTAGANDAMLYAMQNGTTAGYKAPTIYYYVDSVVGWFSIDSDNNAKVVDDKETLDKLSNLDIYYVSNKEKILEVSYNGGELDSGSLIDGVEYKNNKLFVNATISKFELRTIDGKKINYIMDKSTSKFVVDTTVCYTIGSGMISDYDSSCGSNIVIPSVINNQEVTGIGGDAFKNKNLESVVIPSTVNVIRSDAFTDNENLETVTIKDKYDREDFEIFKDDAFDENTKIVFDNDLTRALNLIPNDYKIKVYSGLDLSSLSNFDISGLATGLIKKKLNSNGYNFDSNVFSDEDQEFSYILNYNKEFSLNVYYEDDKYNISLYKNIFNDDYWDYKYVEKEINIIFDETGNLVDKLAVDNVVSNIEEDDSEFGKSIKEKYNSDFVTRRRYLEDFEDNSDLEYVFHSSKGSDIPVDDQIDTDFANGDFFVLKDDILYNVEDNFTLIRLDNTYRPTISIDDYEDIDLFVDDVLKKFEEKTGITDYTIKLSEDGKRYSISSYNTTMNYYVYLVDNQYLENWQIYASKSFDDVYDESGNTVESCFRFSEGTITGYNGECGANVRIPNTIAGEDVTNIGDSVFSYINLYSVKLPDTLIEIAYGAFMGNNLQSVELPDGLVNIGGQAFSYNEIESVVIPDSVEILDYAAFQSNNIKTVIFGNGLEIISSGAFEDNEIVSVNLSDSIKEIENNAFYNNKIKELIIPDGVEKVYNEAFAKNSIESLKLPEILYVEGGAFNDNQLSDEDAFIYAVEWVDYDYENDVEIYEVDKTTIVSYGGAKRENIQIPDGVTGIGSYCFESLGLKEFDIPYGIEWIGDDAFANNELTEISVPDSVQYGGSIFRDNKFEGDNQFIYLRDENGNIDYTTLFEYSNSGYEIEKLEIPKQIKEIREYAFSNYLNVDELIIPYGVEKIGDYAFRGIHLNNSITIPKSVNDIGKYVFENYYAEDLSDEQLFVYGRNEDGTVDKSVLMAYISNVYVDLIIPEGIEEIRENVFYDKIGWLEDVKVNITLPSTLKRIGNSAFAGNYSYLNNIVLNEGLEEIGDMAFSYNDFTEIEIPGTVKTIGEDAFAENNQLEKVILNEGLEVIGEAAFSWTRVNSISLPSTLNKIGNYAFYNGYVFENIKVYGKNSLDEFEYFGVDALNIDEATIIEYINE